MIGPLGGFRQMIWRVRGIVRKSRGSSIFVFYNIFINNISPGPPPPLLCIMDEGKHFSQSFVWPQVIYLNSLMTWVRILNVFYLSSKLKTLRSFQSISSSLKNSKSMQVPWMRHLVSETLTFCSKKSSKMYGGWLTFTYLSEWKMSTFFVAKKIGHFMLTWIVFGDWIEE